jgi:hypothetical protein
MKHSLNHYIYTWLPIGLAGGILAIAYLFWLNQGTYLQGVRPFPVFLYLWVVFGLSIYLLWFRVLAPRLQIYSNRWKIWWLIGCLAGGLWLAVNIPLHFPGPVDGLYSLPPYISKALFLICSGIGIGLALFTLSVLVATRTVSSDTYPQRRFRWLAFALPMVTTWIIYLLAFWPGMMSADSIDQWGQVISGNYFNHHPAFHTFTIWLLTRLSLTPAVVALAQIIALGLVAGYILAYFETLGVPPLILWLASFLFAFSPVNGSMVVTLWKDIPYSTALLGLTFLIFRLVLSNGQWITVRKNWLLLGATVALVALFRHNGSLVFLGTFLLLLWGFHQQWKSLVYAFSFSMVLYLGITGPVYRLANVQESSILADSMSLYAMAANSDPGTNNDYTLKSMMDFSKGWDCTIAYSFEPPNQSDTLVNDKNFLQKAYNLARFAPSLLMYDYRCNRSLIWIIWDPYGEIRNPSHAQYWIDPNPYGITPDSKIPVLRSAITDFVVKTSQDPQINWLVWRPAIYLYLFLLTIAFTALRYKNFKLLLTTGPILIQAIGATLIPLLPNFRYHYAAYLLALLFWPILFIRKGHEDISQSSIE